MIGICEIKQWNNGTYHFFHFTNRFISIKAFEDRTKWISSGLGLSFSSITLKFPTQLEKLVIIEIGKPTQSSVLKKSGEKGIDIN